MASGAQPMRLPCLLLSSHGRRVRGSAMGFAYNFGRGIGATFPALVGYISATMPLSSAIAIFAAIAYSLMGIAAFLLPETRGRTLAS